MWPKKFNCIPLYVAIWLQDIRHTTEEYEEISIENSPSYKIEDEKSSNDSIYDNVEQKDLRENAIAEKEKGNPSTTRSNVHVEPAKPASENSEPCDRIPWGKFHCPTWPLRKFPTMYEGRSLRNLLEYLLREDDKTIWFRLKDESRRIIHFNWLRSQLTMIKRVLNLSDIIYGRDFGEFTRQEEEKPSVFTFMSNLLTSYRERHTQESVWTWLNGNNG